MDFIKYLIVIIILVLTCQTSCVVSSCPNSKPLDCGSYCTIMGDCTSITDNKYCGCDLVSSCSSTSCAEYDYNIISGGKCTGILGIAGNNRCLSNKCGGEFCCSAKGKSDIADNICTGCRELGLLNTNVGNGDCSSCIKDYYLDYNDGKCHSCPSSSTTTGAGNNGVTSCKFGDEGSICNANSDCNSNSCKTYCCGASGLSTGTINCTNDVWGESIICGNDYYIFAIHNNHKSCAPLPICNIGSHFGKQLGDI